MTTDVAKSGGLVLGTDYAVGASFKVGELTLYTAKLLGDPIALTIRVMDKAGFYTKRGTPRWVYSDGPIGIPAKLWNALTHEQKVLTIGVLYAHEGGTTMMALFA